MLSSFPKKYITRVLASAKRLARRFVVARLDRDVMERLQSFGPGYSSRINTILGSVMKHQQR